MSLPALPPVTTSTYPLDDRMRFNHIQVRGTHNSYHLRTRDNPYLAWQYDMPPLVEQFDAYGMRAFEFDVHVQDGGFSVYHIDGDARSTCPLLTDCLAQIVTWSRHHPEHAPIIVFLELKGDWKPANVDALDQVVRGGVPGDLLFRPDHLTDGRYDTVLAAVQAAGWPSMGRMRGKILFSLLAYQPLPFYYTYEGRTLRDRALFITATSSTDSPHAVVLSLDYPVEQEAQIRDAVLRGYLVRTRADDYPGRIQDPGATLRAALRGGAHFVLTDFPAGSSYFPGYLPLLPGGAPARCNPVLTCEACFSAAIETGYFTPE